MAEQRALNRSFASSESDNARPLVSAQAHSRVAELGTQHLHSLRDPQRDLVAPALKPRAETICQLVLSSFQGSCFIREV